MAIDLSADQALIDGLETVLLQQSADGTAYTFSDAYQLPDVLGEGEPSEGGYLQRACIWHLPAKDDAGVLVYPKPGDTITDLDTTVWVIQDVRAPKFGDFWGLSCLVSSITADTLAPSLQDQVTLYPAVDTLDEWGSQIRSHTAAFAGFTDVPAKITLQPSAPEEYAGQREFVEMYDIYVASDVGQVNSGDVLKDQDAKIYQIVSYRNRTQIDELSTIVCELRPRA